MRAKEPDALPEPGEFGVGVSAEFLVVLRDIVPPDLLQVIHRGVQSHGTRDVRGAGFESVWGLLPGAPLKLHVQDHFPAALIRRHGFEHFRAPIQNPDACWPAHLMPRQDQEIAPNFLHVNGPVPGALRGIHERRHAELARPGAQLHHRIDRAERVGNMRHREQLHLAGEALVEAVHVEEADVAGDGQIDQLGTRALGQQLPRDNVAMVLHLREQDYVTRFDVLRAPGLRHQIDAFGGPARENDLVRAARVDELGSARPRGLEGIRGAIAQFVNPTMDIRVVVLVVMPQGLEHRARLLRGGGVVEVDQRLAMHLLIEDGKVGPNG